MRCGDYVVVKIILLIGMDLVLGARLTVWVAMAEVLDMVADWEDTAAG